MKRNEVIEKMCAIQGVVAHSIRGEMYPADCFCHKMFGTDATYQNSGNAIEYIRQAVMEKLKRDGVTISSSDFDENGEWVKKED